MDYNQEEFIQVETELKLEQSLRGRIDNLALSATPTNSLIPLFEAIMNSFHSVQERFGDEVGKLGKIKIGLIHEDMIPSLDFEIIDNGVGLNDENIKSFRTYDSRHKYKKGGKGVGRLTWLKAFSDIKITSIYSQGSNSFRRNLKFTIDDLSPIKEHSLAKLAPEIEPMTHVKLCDMKSNYYETCPKTIKTLANFIAAHFMSYLVSDACPSIVLNDEKAEIEIKELISSKTYNKQEETIVIEDVGNFKLKHLLIEADLNEGKVSHSIYISAHDRIVKEHVINNQLGLDSDFDFEGKKVTYIGIISGELFDKAVTQERNNFDLDASTLKQITKNAEESAQEYLKEPIDIMLAKKAKNISKVVNNFPRYSYLVADTAEFARKLPLNAKTNEQIYQQLSIHDFRATNEIKSKISNILREKLDPIASEDFKENLDNLLSNISDQEKSALAEYVSKRKLIIELLSDKLGYVDEENELRYKEEAIHRVISPMRVDSGSITYGKHNLWLIDDRLAFYDYWASDKQIKEFAKDSTSTSRPDLILFQGNLLLRREGTDQPVVIVEFKRPARKDYSEDENPVAQVFDYIRELRNKKISDNKNRLITEIGTDTPFFCYVVCDVTPRLINFLENLSITQKLPGNRGYFGYNPSLRAYVEVLEYAQIVKDAKLRHEAFFKELGLN